MLGQRIATATVLLAILAAVLIAANPWWFLLILSLTAAGATWEWLRLTLPQRFVPVVATLAALLLFLGTLGLAWCWLSANSTQGVAGYHGVIHALVSLVAGIWLFCAVPAVMRARVDKSPVSVGWSIFALLAMLATWSVLALFFLYRGTWFVLSLLVLVWVADMAAYFAGHAFGRHKLAPRVSQGKTIEGAVVGVLAAVIWVALSSLWPGSFGQALVARWTWALALPLAALLGIASIVGDLFESLLKRRAGRKDASGLLPGHGGIYDRIDAILPVAPLAWLMSGVLF
jgi:phosphatidate cytidylyltransferase